MVKPISFSAQKNLQHMSEVENATHRQSLAEICIAY